MHDIKRIEQFMQIMRDIHRIVLPKELFDTESDVTPLQLEVLFYLHIHPRSKVGAVGKHLNLSSSAIAQLTDRLAKSGYIEREDNPRDRRSVMLLLTQKGNRVFSQLHETRIRKIRKVLGSIPEKDFKEFVRIFKNFHQNMVVRRGG